MHCSCCTESVLRTDSGGIIQKIQAILACAVTAIEADSSTQQRRKTSLFSRVSVPRRELCLRVPAELFPTQTSPSARTS